MEEIETKPQDIDDSRGDYVFLGIMLGVGIILFFIFPPLAFIPLILTLASFFGGKEEEEDDGS